MIYRAPVNDMLFLVDEWIGLERLKALPGYEDLGREDFEFILEEAGKFCVSELLPLNRSGDEHGARFENGEVTTPPGFKAAYEAFAENGWSIIDADPDHGGQGLPRLLKFQIDEMMSACNLSFKLYTELSQGAYHLMAASAGAEIRARYLPQMVAGAWSGTMCLTEPHCGTDLGLLRTAATPKDDGSYAISGTKIFITSGDHDLTDNILHMVLARLEGAPPGPRGISLFLVPKTLVDENGGLAAANAVSTGSIEHKMGIRGSATCVLNFNGSRGYLIGEENRGLAAMFKMMNIERLVVGIQGLGIAEIAYQNALVYARDRLQSKAPPPRPEDAGVADPIILQPDIRRKLLVIRSQVEGARALAALAGLHTDLMEKSDDAAERAASARLVALLTPVVKSYLSDLGVSSALAAQQVYGGHGYICEHGMEQLVRDARIAPIYEGTNEVQAVDLVTRKLPADDGRAVDELLADWGTMLDRLAGDGKLQAWVAPAAVALGHLVECTAWMQRKQTDEPAVALGAATDYQRLFGLVAIACLWADIVVTIRGRDGAFYDAKRKTARFYMEQVLPETESLQRIILGGAGALAAVTPEDFGD